MFHWLVAAQPVMQKRRQDGAVTLAFERVVRRGVQQCAGLAIALLPTIDKNVPGVRDGLRGLKLDMLQFR